MFPCVVLCHRKKTHPRVSGSTGQFHSLPKSNNSSGVWQQDNSTLPENSLKILHEHQENSTHNATSQRYLRQEEQSYLLNCCHQTGGLLLPAVPLCFFDHGDHKQDVGNIEKSEHQEQDICWGIREQIEDEDTQEIHEELHRRAHRQSSLTLPLAEDLRRVHPWKCSPETCEAKSEDKNSHLDHHK